MMKRTAILAVATILLTTSLVSASLPFADDFNRPDGVVGNGWTPWGGGGDIVAQRLRTVPRTDAGGIARELTLLPGEPFTFEFDFWPEDSVNGGWSFQANTTNPEHFDTDNQDRLLFFFQHAGYREIQYRVGANLYGLTITPENLRPFLTTAHIRGVVESDLSATITIDYQDGGPLAVATFASPGIDPVTIPQGNLLSLGNSNDRGGDDFFDDFVLSPEPSTALLFGLATGFALLRRKRK